MTSPLASFLEGLTGGFESGHGLRQDRDERRRKRENDDRERQRRDFERGRGDAERAQETGIEYVPSRAPDLVRQFDEGLPGRADRLRRGVGDALFPRSDMVFQHFGDEVAIPRVRGMEDRIQFGGFQQVRPSAEDQRAIDTEARNAELAAAVGNHLSKTRPELGIAPGSREAMLLGMGKLPTEPVTWEPRTRDEQLQWLRDTGVVAQRTRAGRSAASAEERGDLATVERQVDDNRSNIARAERAVPVRGLLTGATPASEAQFLADSTSSANRLRSLQQRDDSLGGVRDSLAAKVQGRPMAPGAGTKTPADWVREVRQQHPDWTPEQVAAEARRRASGGR